MDERIPEDIESGRRKNPLARICMLIGFLAAATIVSMGHKCYAGNLDERAEAGAGKSLDHVALQLTWYHEFQFAGYYAAQLKGFYAEEGLEVEIRDRISSQLPVDAVLPGEADFGHANSDIVLLHMQGKPVVVLACIMQHSPWSLLVRVDSGISTLDDLIGKTVSMDMNYRDAEILAMFRDERISTEKMTLVKKAAGVENLVNGTIDARVSYLSNEPFALREKGIEPRVIRPINYGIDFYGDTLFTCERQIREHPERVAAFRRASLRGWRYAMERPEELIDHIVSTYYADSNPGGVSYSREHLRFEATVMAKDLMHPELIETGHMNPHRWRRIADTYAAMEMAEPIDSLEDFIYDPDPDSPGTFYRWLYVALGLFVGVVFVGALARVWNKRLHRAVTQRTGELRAANQQLKAHEQQLIASEQQLRAANQQLQAHEQQLQASNQQLLASEQQLKGANQQLIASEQTLRQSEAHYRGLVNSIDGIVWECDARTFGFTFVSEQAEKILGYPVECWLAEPTFWKDHIHKDDRGWAPEFCMQATSDKRDHEFEYRMIGADNQIVWLRDIVRVVVENNEPVKLCGMMIDITERKQAEETLHLSEEKFSKAFHASPDSIAITSLDNGQLLEVNEGFEKMFGYSREEALGKTTVELNLWQSSEDRDAMIKEFENSGRVRDLEIHIRDKTGDIRDCLVSCETIDVEGEACLVSVARDITERKNREKELSEYRNKLRSLVSELTIAEDRERKNIASLLHDDILQKLAFSKMKLGMLREMLTSGDQIETLDNIHTHVGEMFKDMRSLTFDLCPPVLYDIGLEAAVRDWLQKEIGEKQGIAVEFETQGESLQLAEDLRVALYRAIREVLLNVTKHARARKVTVILAKLDDTVRVEVADDGIGFERARAEKDEESSGGLGLFTVRERLEHFGGSLEIESEPGKGSRVVLTAALASREGTGKETA